MRRISILCAAACAVLALVPSVGAEDPLRPVERRLYRQCVNEAGFDSPQDCAAIWQTTLVVARSREPAALMRAQAVLSPRLIGDREPSGIGNIGWTQHLKLGPHAPASYPAAWPWHPRRVERLQGLVERLVRGQERRRPCDGWPVTWGGPGLDEGLLEQRNERRRRAGRPPLVVLDCGPTRNFFVGRPR